MPILILILTRTADADTDTGPCQELSRAQWAVELSGVGEVS